MRLLPKTLSFAPLGWGKVWNFFEPRAAIGHLPPCTPSRCRRSCHERSSPWSVPRFNCFYSRRAIIFLSWSFSYVAPYSVFLRKSISQLFSSQMSRLWICVMRGWLCLKHRLRVSSRSSTSQFDSCSPTLAESDPEMPSAGTHQWNITHELYRVEYPVERDKLWQGGFLSGSSLAPYTLSSQYWPNTILNACPSECHLSFLLPPELALSSEYGWDAEDGCRSQF